MSRQSFHPTRFSLDEAAQGTGFVCLVLIFIRFGRHLRDALFAAAMKAKARQNSPMKDHSVSTLSAFSLVEVVLALGICSFAMVAIVGMIPVGLSTFRDAMNTTVQSQIVQRIAGDVLLTEYQNLTLLDEDKDHSYYNDQGTAVLNGSAKDLAYTARISAPQVLSQKGDKQKVTPGEKVVIKIAKTHPGQSFDEAMNASPSHIYSYSVIVANNK